MTAQEISSTTRFNFTESERIATALDRAPAFLISAFRAMVSVGFYDADEIVERLRALRMMAK